MAPGGSLLLALLALLLGPAGPSPSLRAEELELHPGEPPEAHVSAPPELVALLPAAAAATVAAGYVPSGPQAEPRPSPAAEAEASPEGILVTAAAAKPRPRPGILIEGDARYQWQEWSPWHCNCARGSMSRVRDITYSVPGVVLDPAQYDVLRFQRVVCGYEACGCNREARQCDGRQAACDEAEKHLCALRDIEQAQRQQRQDFWARLHARLARLWQSLKEAFPQRRKDTKSRR